eukprot:jgi/Hompol1/5378/HPOL_001959-RA
MFCLKHDDQALSVSRVMGIDFNVFGLQLCIRYWKVIKSTYLSDETVVFGILKESSNNYLTPKDIEMAVQGMPKTMQSALPSIWICIDSIFNRCHFAPSWSRVSLNATHISKQIQLRQLLLSMILISVAACPFVQLTLSIIDQLS